MLAQCNCWDGAENVPAVMVYVPTFSLFSSRQRGDGGGQGAVIDRR